MSLICFITNPITFSLFYSLSLFLFFLLVENLLQILFSTFKDVNFYGVHFGVFIDLYCCISFSRLYFYSLFSLRKNELLIYMRFVRIHFYLIWYFFKYMCFCAMNCNCGVNIDHLSLVFFFKKFSYLEEFV